MENEVIICAECGCIIEDADRVEPYKRKDGQYICEHCRENYYVYCSECEELVHEDDVVVVDGEWVCEDCLENSDNYFRCDDCGEWHNRYRGRWLNNYYRVSGGGIICEDCFREDYYQCDDCGEAVRSEDVDEIDGDYYCPYCSERHRKRIHNYGYKPEPIFKNIHDVFFNRFEQEENAMYFGVELEVDDGDCREDCATDLIDASDDIYCKEDSSLDEGIEIVTHPCTLAYHTEALGWGKLCEIAKSWGFKSQYAGTCGLHVHVGKRALEDDSGSASPTIAKIIMLVCRHWDELVKFSRRKSGQLSDWARKPEFNYGSNIQETINEAMSTAYASSARYQAVNLTNTNTIEFRLFNGTLRRNTIIATLQLVSNICHYAKDKDFAECMASQWSDVAEYVEYDELSEYLELRGLSRDLFNNAKEPDQFARPYIETFAIGDRVKLRNMPWQDGWMNGLTARVAAIEHDEIGISFDCGDLDGMNTLDGLLPAKCGLWIEPRWAAVVKRRDEGRDEECA